MCVCVLPCNSLLLNLAAFALGVFGGAPMQCNLSVLATLQADFLSLSHTQTSGRSLHNSAANNRRLQLQRAGHEPVCLVPEWTDICLCLPGLFLPTFSLILRAFYSADIGINTASSCENSTCFVPELVAGSLPRLSLRSFDN